MKIDKFFFIPVIVLFSLLLIFIHFYDQSVHKTKQENLDNHSRIIASAMWIYESEGVVEYLKLACKAGNYKSLKVIQNNGDTFIDTENQDRRTIDNFLLSINLITSEDISSPVVYRDKIIGKITATWYNKSIYIYLYLIVVIILLITILWFYLHIQKAKQELEIRVEERTYDLQEEIIERKQTEAALRQSQSNYRILIENIPQKIFLKDTSSIYLTCNENFANDLNKTPPEIVGKTDFDSFPEELAEKYRLDDTRIISNKSIEEFEEKYVAQGKEHIVKTIKTVVSDEAGNVTGLLGIFWDITEQRRLENQLRQALKMESVGTLAGGIAHDFNNILSIIIGNTELAMGDIPEDNPAFQSLEELKIASLRARDVVRQLLSFARKTQVEKKPTDIFPVIEESLFLLRSSIPTNIEINQNLSHNIHPIVCDSVQINQILINLCTNAYHAMVDDGTITVTLKNFLFENSSAQRYPELAPGQYVMLSVSDTGRGIANKHIDRIFDPYFTTKEVDKGTGMGLAVVHGIVKEHGGTVHVKSQLEEGTEFTILFPAYEGKIVPETKIQENAPKGDERILFVDDEAPLAKAAHRILESLGYQVDSTTSPNEALKLFCIQPEKYDLVITDMAMPQMAGDQLITEILQVRPEVKIILCTGFSEKIDEATAKKLGAHGYIEKPFSKSNFAQNIRKVLESS